MNTLSHIPGVVPDVHVTWTAPTEAARELVTKYVTDNADALAELLDACVGETAGARARALGRLTDAERVDPAAARDLVRAAQDDLLGLPIDADPVAPEKLVRIAHDDLDAAVRYHLGRLATLGNLLAELAAR